MEVLFIHEIILSTFFNQMQKFYFLLFLFFTLTIISCKKETIPHTQNITIGGLLSLTGNWSSLGITSQEAMSLAIVDINNYMIQTGSRYRFSTLIYDTKLDTLLAQAAIKDAQGKNIHLLIGPQSSAELGAIRKFANDNKILVVSQGSTASVLAIADDALFRFCPGDVVEGRAMAQTMYQSGLRKLITLARDDIGNKGLQNSVGLAFSDLGGIIDAVTPYPTNATDFTSILAALKAKIQYFSNGNNSAQVGVYLASFDECAALFEQASGDPVFSSVNWYGGDGVVFSDALISNATASQFAANTGFFVPNFGLPKQANPLLAPVAAAIKSKTGLDADAYTLSVYDAMWVIAKSETAFSQNNIDYTTLKDVFLEEADRHYGITGPVTLNAAGDRSIGSFDFWGVVSQGANYTWKLVGKSL